MALDAQPIIMQQSSLPGQARRPLQIVWLEHSGLAGTWRHHSSPASFNSEREHTPLPRSPSRTPWRSPAVHLPLHCRIPCELPCIRLTWTKGAWMKSSLVSSGASVLVFARDGEGLVVGKLCDVDAEGKAAG